MRIFNLNGKDKKITITSENDIRKLSLLDTAIVISHMGYKGIGELKVTLQNFLIKKFQEGKL